MQLAQYKKMKMTPTVGRLSFETKIFNINISILIMFIEIFYYWLLEPAVIFTRSEHTYKRVNN